MDVDLFRCLLQMEPKLYTFENMYTDDSKNTDFVSFVTFVTNW